MGGRRRRHAARHERRAEARPAPPAGAPISLERVDPWTWRIPADAARGMLVDGLVFSSDLLIAQLRDDPALQQVANVATLPGVVGASLAMPDVHWGYGFPVGGVAAMEVDGGVVSPGGIGFDINCGVRLLATDLAREDVASRLGPLADALFGAVPSGIGARAGHRLGRDDLDAVLSDGAAWVVAAQDGDATDLGLTEERGGMPSAAPEAVSPRARQRGAEQLGTLGSGNHFLEVQVVDAVLDEAAAGAMDLRPGQVVIMIHCGSRGLGHQVCTDHVAAMDRSLARYRISLPDRQLACAPLGSPEADAYLGAMAAAANFAWANRQAITQAVRGVWLRLFGAAAAGAVRMIYDLSHNIAKLERHTVGGVPRDVCVHRKGATRAFPPGHPDVPDRYRAVGQPVLIPGDMGRASFVAVGAPGAMQRTFGSTCHGAGRNLSRHAALRLLRGIDIAAQLAAQGIVVRAERHDLLAEEASPAYRDAAQVVEVAAGAGMVRPAIRLLPLAVIKG